MNLHSYFQKTDNRIEVSRQQASDFAKQVAGDFNPIHDIDAKRFCVPGDLLFSLVLNQYGLSKKMQFRFSDMVGGQIPLHFSPSDDGELCIHDDKGKCYLRVNREGDSSREEPLVSNLTKNYVAFSGHTFPHVLVPLMAKHNVMINPERPLIIYESMGIDLHTLAISNPQLELVDAQLSVNGKRGDVLLKFRFVENGKEIGCGRKTMVLSGLRPYEQQVMDAVVDLYEQRKQQF